MNYTDKILEEFEEKFGALLDMLEKLYGGNPEEMTTFKEALKSFLSTSIHQAIAEDRERIRAEIESKQARSIKVHFNKESVFYRLACKDLLDSLDKLTDKE